MHKPMTTPKRVREPALFDIRIAEDGLVYLNKHAYERYWSVKGKRAYYTGAFVDYNPETRNVIMIPETYYAGTNNAVTIQGRGYTMRLAKLLKKHGIELTRPVHAKIEQRGDLLVFSIKGCIQEGE